MSKQTLIKAMLWSWVGIGVALGVMAIWLAPVTTPEKLGWTSGVVLLMTFILSLAFFG